MSEASPRESSLLHWMERADPRRGIHVASDSGSWELWSYEGLAQRTRNSAAALRAAGVARGEVVAIIAQPGVDFVAAFFAALLIGAVPSALPPPATFQGGTRYRAHLSALLDAASPSFIVTAESCATAVRAAARANERVATLAELLALCGPDVPFVRETSDHALLQFTSGSTGPGKGLRLRRSALESNIDAIARWLGNQQRSDAVASWLPCHHDMGLVGCLLWPVTYGLDLWLMTPEQFLRKPVDYLRCFGPDRATVGAIPPFALDFIARRVPRDGLTDVDMTRCKAIVVGAERIASSTLRRFTELLLPCGLSPGALLPAYGLAEATCAVTGATLGRGPTSLPLSRGALSLGRDVLSAPHQAAQPIDELVEVVSCGRALDGTTVSIVDDEGRTVPDGHVGEIAVRGPSLANLQQSDSETWHALQTGDAGFIVEGELYVLGRIGDGVKFAGVTVLAEELEQAVVDLCMTSKAPVVLLGTHEELVTAVAIVDSSTLTERERIVQLLRARTGATRVCVVAATAGVIERTTSGKPRRRSMWIRFVQGEFGEFRKHCTELAPEPDRR